MITLLTALTATSYILFLVDRLTKLAKTAFRQDIDIEIPYTVSVIVCGWREPRELVEISLRSLREQTAIRNPKNDIEIIFVGCRGIDLETVEKYADKIICAPRGKLKARHIAIQHSRGEIVVSCDADTYYPPAWLALLLQPYLKEENIVATCGPIIGGLGYSPTLGLVASNLLYLSYALPGINSSMLKDAYFKARGFNTHADTEDIYSIWYEEEISLRRRLEKIGKIRKVPEAACITLEALYREDRGLAESLRRGRELDWTTIWKKIGEKLTRLI